MDNVGRRFTLRRTSMMIGAKGWTGKVVPCDPKDELEATVLKSNNIIRVEYDCRPGEECFAYAIDCDFALEDTRDYLEAVTGGVDG